MNNKNGSIFNSPFLLVALVMIILALSAAWHKSNTMLSPPSLPGYNWAEHPNALLIVYPEGDCGCAPPSDIVVQGLNNGLDVVVISPKPSESLDGLRRDKLDKNKLLILTNIDMSIIKRFSPKDKPSVVRVKDGTIVRRSEGGIPSEKFWR